MNCVINKRAMLLVLGLLCSGVTAGGQSSRPTPDLHSFELTPAPPAQPALTHQLLFSFPERFPGNAAIAYLDAILLMGNDASDTADKALAAYDKKDFKTFDSLADSLAQSLATTFDELDVAGRREECDWQPPMRQRGVMTLLPHLSPLAKPMTNLIKIRALRQIEQGQVEEALQTLRLGYELGEKVGREPVLVSGLVSLRITSRMNDALVELMNRPEAPNLYWALSVLPPRQPILRRAWDAEHRWLFSNSALQRQSSSDLTAEQWRTVLIDDMAPFYQNYENYKYVGVRPHPDPIKDAGPDIIRQAREEYAKLRNVSADEVAKVDSAIVLGSFYYRQWQIAADEIAKLRGLPYPVMLQKTAEMKPMLDRLRREQRTNPFVQTLEDFHSSVSTFARTDRQIAALMAVEALRSYAAANGGVLPQKLEEITETPVPLNPATGKPFEYQLAQDLPIATLSDTQSEVPLKYTIKIRK